MHYLSLILLLLSFIAQSQEPQNKSLWLNIHLAHPTQSTLGQFIWLNKKEKIEKKYAQGDLTKYLKKKKIPCVIGPDGLFYILDGHHTTRALLESSIPDHLKKIRLNIIRDWRKKSWYEFWNDMKKYRWVYLKKRGHPILVNQIPRNFLSLENDPYRTLATLVRKNNGFNKVSISFAEFYWADFFRNKFKQRLDSFDKISALVLPATNLAKSKLACHLPGHHNPCTTSKVISSNRQQ